MDYLYIVNAFKQQQQQFLLHQHQLQQQLQNHHNSAAAAGNPLSLQQQHDNTNMANSLLWQPWRDLQHAAAVHHHLYRQQQQQQQQHQEQMEKEARLSSKELPTTAWRRERRLRAGEYHNPSTHHHRLISPGTSTSGVRADSPSSSPPPAAHSQLSPTTSSGVASTQLHSNAHQISMMMAAAAAAGMRPLCESTNRPSPPPPSSHAVGAMHLGHIVHTQVLHQMSGMETDDAPLDMSVSSSLKQRNSPPPPYREPLPGSTFASSLPRPSVITQAPPKRDIRDITLIANRENDNRSSESIDEHFRRSLGNDYFALFAKKSPGSQSTKAPSPQPNLLPQPPAAHARTPPPTPIATTVTSIVLPPPPALNQTALVPPPAYPNSSLPPHQQHQQQPQTLKSPKNNTLVHCPALAGAQMKSNPAMLAIAAVDPNSSPPLPLVVRPPIQQQQPQLPLALQRSLSVTAPTPLPSPQSPLVKTTAPAQSPVSSTAGSRTVSPLPSSNQQVATMTLSRFTSVENSPSSSPRHTPPVVANIAVPNSSPTLPAIMRIKTEPGLQSIKSHNPTPPASPTSTTNPNIIMMSSGNSQTGSPSSPSSPSAASASSTATMKTNSTTPGSNSSAEVLASVDDHFAKALGDTWKRLQESKEMRK